jgi:hypothetical protein
MAKSFIRTDAASPTGSWRKLPETPVPENPTERSQGLPHYRHPRARLDIPDKVMGKTVYGMDFTMPGMCIAVVAQVPILRRCYQSYDEESGHGGQRGGQGGAP